MRHPLAERGSGNGRSASTANATAASAAERVRRPMLSSLGESGKTPSIGHTPTVVFKPKTPQKDAGTRTDPPVSVPTANAESPAATATADPLLDPPGTRWTTRSQGFQGVPRTLLIPAAP